MSVLVAEYLYIQVRGNIGNYSILSWAFTTSEGLSILVLFCGVYYVGYWAGRGEEADEEASEETE